MAGIPPPSHIMPDSQAPDMPPGHPLWGSPLRQHQAPPVPLPLCRSPVGHVMTDPTSRASAVLRKGSHGSARPSHSGKGKEPSCPSTPGLLTILHTPGSLLTWVGSGVGRVMERTWWAVGPFLRLLNEPSRKCWLQPLGAFSRTWSI